MKTKIFLLLTFCTLNAYAQTYKYATLYNEATCTNPYIHRGIKLQTFVDPNNGRKFFLYDLETSANSPMQLGYYGISINNTTYRGYNEFDLSKIEKDANITKQI